jgi:hypothetical protein
LILRAPRAQRWFETGKHPKEKEAVMTQPSTEKSVQGLPPAEAIELPSLLSVVPESVVSRTLIKRGGGNVTLFSFDRGQGLS